jgi:hypothetical protein
LPSSVKAERAGVVQLGHLGQRLAAEPSASPPPEADSGTRASRRACSRSDSSTRALSTTGSVFGIATTAT